MPKSKVRKKKQKSSPQRKPIKTLEQFAAAYKKLPAFDAAALIADEFKRAPDSFDRVFWLLDLRSDKQAVALAAVPMDCWWKEDVPFFLQDNKIIASFSLVTFCMLNLLSSTLERVFASCDFHYMEECLMLDPEGNFTQATFFELLIWYTSGYFASANEQGDKEKQIIKMQIEQAISTALADIGIFKLSTIEHPLYSSKGDFLEAAKISGNTIAERLIRQRLGMDESEVIAGVVAKPTAPIRRRRGP